jgi:hypothetical protein
MENIEQRSRLHGLSLAKEQVTSRRGTIHDHGCSLAKLHLEDIAILLGPDPVLLCVDCSAQRV